MTDFHVLTAAGVPFRTFDDRAAAVRFARSKRDEYPGCRVVMVSTVTQTVPIWTDRAHLRLVESAA